MIENMKEPKAIATLYENFYDSFGFSDREIFDFVKFLIVPAFFDILVCKYEDHIEFMIHVTKTDNEILKLQRTKIFHSIIKSMNGVLYESLTNSYVTGKEYDCLTAKCMLHAVNQ